MAYATQVGAVMNTAVGLLQAEEVGGMKKTMVGKSYSINVGDKFEISVGDSKLTMTTDSISITSKSILVAAEKSNTIIGKNVEINPLGEASAGGEDEAYESNVVVRDQDGNIVPEDQRLPLAAGPGMYGTDEIPGSASAKKKAEERANKLLNKKEGYDRAYGKGNHKYNNLSSPICQMGTENCNVDSIVNAVNNVGVHPNQTRPFVPGSDYVGDVDIPGPFGIDHVKSTAVYNNQGQQVGVRNETLENHALHPGIVERRVIQRNGNYHILTEGGGYGYLGGPNIWLDSKVWSPVDNKVVKELNE